VGGECGVVPPTHCRLSGYFPGTPYIGVLLEWQPPQPLHTQRVGGKSQLASEGGGGHRGAGRKTPPFALRGGVGGGPYGLKGPSPHYVGKSWKNEVSCRGVSV
jgi:hypothetical protein